MPLLLFLPDQRGWLSAQWKWRKEPLSHNRSTRYTSPSLFTKAPAANVHRAKLWQQVCWKCFHGGTGWCPCLCLHRCGLALWSPHPDQSYLIWFPVKLFIGKYRALPIIKYMKICTWHCFQCAISALSGQGSLTTESHERESAECLFALFSNQKAQCEQHNSKGIRSQPRSTRNKL